MADPLRSIGFDRYDLNARLRPALFVLLPVFVIAFFWLPRIGSLVGGVISVLSACGALYLMAQAARHRGRIAERKLGDRIGRPHSARMLLHADTAINVMTKTRYHAYLRAHGRDISLPEEEVASPEIALARARSAVDWLLEHTRPMAKTSLLFDENIAYGFRRNLFGMKPVAIAIVILALIIHGTLLWFRPLGEDMLWTGLLTALMLGILLLLWILLVTSDFVADASHAYALRLFSQCEAIRAVGPVTPRRAAPKKRVTGGETK